MRIRPRILLRTALAIILAGSGAERALAEDATDAFKSFPSISGSRKMPKLTSFNPLVSDPTQNGELKDVKLEALLTADGQPVESGLTWRVFSPIPGGDGKLPLLATSEGGSTAFNLVPGEYFVNVAFGRAAATRKIRVPEQGALDKQILVLDAGGVMLNAVSGSDVRIPPTELSFSIFSSDEKEDGESKDKPKKKVIQETYLEEEERNKMKLLGVTPPPTLTPNAGRYIISREKIFFNCLLV